jgi:HD-GYP domain-containing protein (c-di-GMP phosphodiesterase class II)
MNGIFGDRVLVCGTDGQFRSAVRRALARDAVSLDFIDNPDHAIEHARRSEGVLLVDSQSVDGGLQGFLDRLSEAGSGDVPVVIRAGDDRPGGRQLEVDRRGILCFVPSDQFEAHLVPVMDLAGHLAQVKRRLALVESQHAATEKALEQLITVGHTLSGHKDVESLLRVILTECRTATRADSGSLYMVEEERQSKGRQLRFRIPQNDSMAVELSNLTLPLGPRSVSGHVAVTGKTLMVDDVYTLPPDAGFSFDRSWDELTSYRSRSMLVVPMKNHKDEVIGIIQLINKKALSDARLVTADDVERSVRPFDSRDREVVEAIAAQAAIAVENTTILEDIMKLFDGFVAASARAVECMDSATSGHCARLATYAVMTAEKINSITEGPLARYKFDRAQLKELRYAALMHDIGKIGVRESVLKKDRRLTEDRLEVIKLRFQYFKEVLKHKAFRQAMTTIFSGAGRAAVKMTDVEKELEQQVQELDEILAYLLKINTYGRLDDPDYDKLKKIAESSLIDVDGVEHRYLTPDEFENLAVRRGNLTPKERLEIEEHVVLTFKILASIPWLPEYRLVPDIAGAHHERIDGSGYPNRLRGDDIPIGGQILAMLDIYEALTASDRPYKPPVSREKALQILEAEAKANHLNPHVVRLFIDSGIYKAVELPKPVERKEGSTAEAW